MGVVVVLGACNSHRAIDPEVELMCEDRDHAFADEVLRYDPTLNGGPFPGHSNFDDPDDALGAPNYSGGPEGSGSVALSLAGVLELGYDECVGLTNGTHEPDLRVHEIGPKIETFVLAIASPDEIDVDPSLVLDDGFILVGLITEQSGEVDVDGPLGLDQPIRIDRVRIVDDPTQSTHGHTAPGADIDAVALFSPVTPD